MNMPWKQSGSLGSVKFPILILPSKEMVNRLCMHAPHLFIWPLWRALAHLGIAKWKSKADQCWQHKKGIASHSFGFYNVKMIKNMNIKWYLIYFFCCKKKKNLAVRGCQLILFWNLCRISLLLQKNEKLYTHFFVSLWYKRSARKPQVAQGLEESHGKHLSPWGSLGGY